MGTNSYILTGTQKGMQETFGSTCHGAGRARSRNNSRNKLSYQEVRSRLHCCHLLACILVDIVLCRQSFG